MRRGERSKFALIGYICDAALLLSVYDSFDHAVEVGEALYSAGLIDAYNVARVQGGDVYFSADALMGILKTWWETCDINLVQLFPKWREWFYPTYLVGACIERKDASVVKRLRREVMDVLYSLGGVASLEQLSVHLKVNPDSLEKIIKYLRHRHKLPVKIVPGKRTYMVKVV